MLLITMPRNHRPQAESDVGVTGARTNIGT